MGARQRHHPASGINNRRQQRHSAGQSAGDPTPLQLESSDLPVRVSRSNPFGPQSQWSSLLWEREYLQDEIVRGEKYLRQLRRNVITGCVLLETWAVAQPVNPDRPDDTTPSASTITASLERSLRDWLDRLQQRLDAVSKDIDILPAQRALEPQRPEESIFTLLRAAG